MFSQSFVERRRLESLEREPLRQLQLSKLNQLLSSILPKNRFYAEKLKSLPYPLRDLAELSSFPLTEKQELLAKDPSGFAANLTFSPEAYVRFHRTSGTQGSPLVVLDTDEDWKWWIDTWQFVLDAADLQSKDRVFMAFSFGPFIGFWSAFDACAKRGAMVLPGGGLSTLARLDMIQRYQPTAVFCTPTYALRLAEVAAAENIDLRATAVDRIIVAGEPGGSLPAVRERIERVWDARVIDHSGASEIGPWGYASADQSGLHVIESEFIAEFLTLDTNEPADDGELAELVITTLGRAGSPVIRYRTGDLVRADRDHPLENRFVLLRSGVVGRSDDMLIVRGVNIFPSAIEQILRSFPEVVEFRITAKKSGEMDALTIEVEDQANDAERIARELSLRLGLKVDVRCVPIGELPRFEAKAKRFMDLRRDPSNE